jgi:Heterokaryon incompatibility protein (HET)
MPPREHMKRKKREAAQAAKIREHQRVASLSPLERFQHLHNRLIGFARKSLRECIQNHGSCPPYIAGVESFLPSRLVDLKDVSKPMVVASRDITGEDRQYACLSHQWGRPDESSKKLMTTTTENIAMRFEGFLLTSLPERYQQAILLCHALDVRYIWIDSLCIIQVSKNVSKCTLHLC